MMVFRYAIMHRSIAVHNPYNLFILTIVYSKNLTTSYLLTIEHMAMFVDKSIHIQINDQVMDLSIVLVVHNSIFRLLGFHLPLFSSPVFQQNLQW